MPEFVLIKGLYRGERNPSEELHRHLPHRPLQDGLLFISTQTVLYRCLRHSGFSANVPPIHSLPPAGFFWISRTLGGGHILLHFQCTRPALGAAGYAQPRRTRAREIHMNAAAQSVFRCRACGLAGYRGLPRGRLRCPAVSGRQDRIWELILQDVDDKMAMQQVYRQDRDTSVCPWAGTAYEFESALARPQAVRQIGTWTGAYA